LTLLKAAQSNIGSQTTMASNLVSGIPGGIIFGPIATVASDGTNVYFTTVSSPATTTGPSTISWLSTSGGFITPIYTTSKILLDLIALNGTLYWVEFTNSDVNPVSAVMAQRFP
jgi:hypothetical protein